MKSTYNESIENVEIAVEIRRQRLHLLKSETYARGRTVFHSTNVVASLEIENGSSVPDVRQPITVGVDDLRGGRSAVGRVVSLEMET